MRNEKYDTVWEYFYLQGMEEFEAIQKKLLYRRSKDKLNKGIE